MWRCPFRSDDIVNAKRFFVAVGRCEAARARLAARARTFTTVEGRCASIWLSNRWGRNSGVDAAAGHASSPSAIADCVMRV